MYKCKRYGFQIFRTVCVVCVCVCVCSVCAGAIFRTFSATHLTMHHVNGIALLISTHFTFSNLVPMLINY